jgi:hypothetical protein
MYISQLMPSPLKRSLLLAGAALALGCEPVSGSRDASAPPQRVAEVSVRIDAPSGGAPAVSLLAFRATVSGPLAGSDVLSVLDPLASAPVSRCELVDVTAAARELRAQGGTIDLQELPNVSLLLGSDTTLKPVPKNYPQLSSGMGGVFGEAGPLELAALPDTISVGLPGEESRLPLAVPGVPRLIDQNGEALVAGTHLDPTRDVQLTVSGAAHAVEIRPYGASHFISCPVGPAGRVVLQHELLEKLTASGSHGAVSFEAVWRDSRMVAGAQPTRLSIEARSSAVLDLRAPVAPPPPPSVP